MARHLLILAVSVIFSIPLLVGASPFSFWHSLSLSEVGVETIPANDFFDERSILDCLDEKSRRPHKHSFAVRGRQWHGKDWDTEQANNSTVSNDTNLARVLGALSTTLDYLTSLISDKYNIRPLPPDLRDFWSVITGDRESNQGQEDGNEGDDDGQHTTQTTSSTSTSVQTSTNSPSTNTASLTSTFDPLARNLNAVYYAQTDLTSRISLAEVCEDPAIDMVLLAFITGFFERGGYPTLNLGSHCWAPNVAQTNAGALGLIDCVGDGFATQIVGCQAQGKKVLLSLGGAVSNTQIPSEEKAVELAEMLWGLFLGGIQNETLTSIRPFSEDVVLDGIDIDNENPANAQHIPTLVSTLRRLFTSNTTILSRRQGTDDNDVAEQSNDDDDDGTTDGDDTSEGATTEGDNSTTDESDPSSESDAQTEDTSNSIVTTTETSDNDASNREKRYYLTAAPQCPRPDLSIPISSMLNDLDFVAVQFYNNPSCNFDTGDSFLSSLLAWSNDLASHTTASTSPGTETANGPRLLIGVPAFSGGGSGYVPPGADFEIILQSINDMGLSNLAGFMYWDGAYQKFSGQSTGQNGTGENFAEIVKAVLE